MLVTLALLALIGKLVADGSLPAWAFYVLAVLVVLGGLGGGSEMIAQAFRIGAGLAGAILFFVVLNATRPDLLRPYIGIALQLLVIYAMVWMLARMVRMLGGGRPSRS